MEKQIKHNLYYYNQQAKLIERANTRASKVALRRNWLKLQNINNYQSEYDRIRAGLDQSTLARNSVPTSNHIKDKITKLRGLRAKALGDHGFMD